MSDSPFKPSVSSFSKPSSFGQSADAEDEGTDDTPVSSLPKFGSAGNSTSALPKFGTIGTASGTPKFGSTSAASDTADESPFRPKVAAFSKPASFGVSKPDSAAQSPFNAASFGSKPSAHKEDTADTGAPAAQEEPKKVATFNFGSGAAAKGTEAPKPAAGLPQFGSGAPSGIPSFGKASGTGAATASIPRYANPCRCIIVTCYLHL